MNNARKLAVAYAATVAEDVHVPTLAKIIVRENLNSLEAVRNFLALGVQPAPEKRAG
ncbi:hypothetical protein [Mesorhizobium sp. YR577]|jgi:hypothetical protein|uniref:hypothetical protein n=1 Tax=Mesorhizobium sp. YR577 TaxID=1884373 RepID=UPI0008F093FB|nr:hypothetical protein [Mesorhizobium sp. YR577]SFT80323.1 hypothetical protein SAMN05518861_105234 [Mesorhizobium sp. YR577]